MAGTPGPLSHREEQPQGREERQRASEKGSWGIRRLLLDGVRGCAPGDGVQQVQQTCGTAQGTVQPSHLGAEPRGLWARQSGSGRGCRQKVHRTGLYPPAPLPLQ